MKVKEFFAVTKGSCHLCFSEDETSLCGRDFWGRYRSDPVWEAEVDHVRLMSRSLVTDGMAFDGVLCVIRLKEARK